MRAFLLLCVLGLPLGFVSLLDSVIPVLLLFSWAMFVAAGFIVVGLRSVSLVYPRGQTSMVAGLGAGTWSALVAVLLPLLGRWFDQQHFDWIFWSVALIPLLGVALWLWLTRNVRPEAGG